MRDKIRETKEALRRTWASLEKKTKEHRIQRLNDSIRAKDEATSLERRISYLEECVTEISKKLKSQ
ncbi:MAG: hypothetical protein Q7R89_01210 [bacterium]|nr:hypothetical protein [bacterium]